MLPANSLRIWDSFQIPVGEYGRIFLIRVKKCIFDEKLFANEKKVVFLQSNSREQRTIKNSINSYVSDKREKRRNIRRVR